jgi:hypothetical protein
MAIGGLLIARLRPGVTADKRWGYAGGRGPMTVSAK